MTEGTVQRKIKLVNGELYDLCRDENARLRKAVLGLIPFAICYKQELRTELRLNPPESPQAKKADENYLEMVRDAITAAREAMKGVEE